MSKKQRLLSVWQKKSNCSIYSSEQIDTGIDTDGNRVLESLDVVKEAGGKDRLLVKEFKKVPAGKALQIELTPVAGRTLLSGVEIIASEG